MDKTVKIEGDEFASRRWPESGKLDREESTGDPLAKLNQDNLAELPEGQSRSFSKLEPEQRPPFQKAMEHLMNLYSRENRSNTPDFILAQFVIGCLFQFEDASNSRERWYGKYLNILKPETTKIPGIQDVDTRSAEGYLFNAAMAILTTEYMPNMTFGAMFDKVADLARKILEDDKKREAQDINEKFGMDFNQEPPKTAFHNAGNRNEKPV